MPILQVLDCPHLFSFCQLVRPGLLLPCRKTFSTSLLFAEYSFILSDLHRRLQLVDHLTVSADGWSDRVRRSILGVTVTFPDGNSMLLRAIDHSLEEHTAANISKHIVEVLERFDIKARVAMLVTDNAAAMAAARRLVVAEEGLQHVIPFRLVLRLTQCDKVSWLWAGQRMVLRNSSI